MLNFIKKSGLVAVGFAAVLGASTAVQAMSFGAPSLEDIQTMLDKEDYAKAIDELKSLVGSDEKNADGWNLLGFAYRKSGNLDLAWDAYERALTLNPDHLGANEYLGELYITQGNMAQASAQLHKLMILCPSGCEALEKLKTAIEAAK